MFETDVAYFDKEIDLPAKSTSVQHIKNKVAIQLIRSWLDDESGYDEKAWLKAKKTIEENKLSKRKKFSD